MSFTMGLSITPSYPSSSFPPDRPLAAAKLFLPDMEIFRAVSELHGCDHRLEGSPTRMVLRRPLRPCGCRRRRGALSSVLHTAGLPAHSSARLRSTRREEVRCEQGGGGNISESAGLRRKNEVWRWRGGEDGAGRRSGRIDG